MQQGTITVTGFQSRARLPFQDGDLGSVPAQEVCRRNTQKPCAHNDDTHVSRPMPAGGRACLPAPWWRALQFDFVLFDRLRHEAGIDLFLLAQRMQG